MWEKLLNKKSYTEKDIKLVVKNIFFAPKELLIKLGLVKPEVKEEKPEVVEEKKPRRTRRTKKLEK